jgi:predicted Zn finger-like uncharacterized protein
MSLATACTACGTVFRVVQDQLKVSEGWVRCGRCSEVFNALEGLFDLERDTAPASLTGPLSESPASAPAPLPPAPHAPPATQRHPPPADSGYESDFDPTEERHDPSLVERLGNELFPERQSALGAYSQSRFTAAESSSFGDSRGTSELRAKVGRHGLDSEILADDELEPLEHDASAAPEFLRHAESAARWQRPWVRLLLSAFALALLGVLSLQLAHHWRDPIAARWPATLPLLSQWCEFASCTIEAPRRIDDIAVESTGFARIAGAGADQFRVSVVLRNRGALTLAMPWVDLSLTDASGNLLARKALSPQDFRSPLKVLAPAGEAQLQLVLATGTPLVTGYTVEIFYP